MTDSIYTKDGRSLRIEIENGIVHSLSLRERGRAIERGRSFECTTLPGEPSDDAPDEPVPFSEEVVALLRSMGGELERATLISGNARHEIRVGETRERWRASSARIHASIINRDQKLRCELDLGGRAISDGWIGKLADLRQAVASCRPGPVFSQPITLEPAVSAAIVASVWSAKRIPSPLFVQVPRAEEIDGYGRRIVERELDPSDPPHTWFRPSYRTRPRPMPHGLDLSGEPTGSELPAARAIALAGHPELERDALRVPCLVLADARAMIPELKIDLEHWNDQIEIVSDREEWFPLLAGVWGRRLIFRSTRNGARPLLSWH